MEHSAIFWPVIVQALLTLSIYIPMFRARVAAAKAGEVETSSFKLREVEPERSAKFVNAIANQYETPVLFYAVCLIAFVTGHASFTMVLLAWLYSALKAAQILVFVTSNRLRHRMRLFAGAMFVLVVMWIVLAAKLAMA